MAHEPGHVDRSAEATADLASFEAIYNKIMNIPNAGRDIYDNWLAQRWREAAANWALSSNAELNRTAVLGDDGQQLFDMVDIIDQETGKATGEKEKVLRWALGENVGESFEDYMNRLKNSTELFGATGKGSSGPSVGLGNGSAAHRLNQLSGMGGTAQRSVLELLGNMLGGTGITGGDIANEAFMNASEGRFGRRGSQALLDRNFNRNEAIEFQRQRLAGERGQNDSFLNTRLTDLRRRYGF